MKVYVPIWLAIPAILILIAVCAGLVLTSDETGRTDEEFSRAVDPVKHDTGIGRERRNKATAQNSRSTSRQLTEKDRADLWQRLINLPDEEAVALLLSLAKRDMSAAYELALAFGGLEGKGEAAREALRGLIGSDLEAAISWGENCDSSLGMELFWASAIDLTAGSDPARAFKFAEKTSGDLRLTLLEDIFAEWANEDVDSARRAAMELASEDERARAHVQLVVSGLDRDLDDTLAWIGSIENHGLRDLLYYEAAGKWAVHDPAGAAGFAGSLVESDYKTHIAGRVVESWIKDDPDPAMAWASKLRDQESREEAISRGIQHSIGSSPDQAANLALRLPAESDRSAALEYVISSWVATDSAALAEWIAQVPDSAARERMNQMMMDHLSSAASSHPPEN